MVRQDPNENFERNQQQQSRNGNHISDYRDIGRQPPRLNCNHQSHGPTGAAGFQERGRLSGRDFQMQNQSQNQHFTAGKPPPGPPLLKESRSTHNNNNNLTAQPLLKPPRHPPSRERSSGGRSSMNATAPNNVIWKRALAQITGKTLDCRLNYLPSKANYMIRTQDQGVVARIQFLSAPNNPALLEHHPSKRNVQDHFVPIHRLTNRHHDNNNERNPETPPWKGQDILSFLKHQDERRTTYQPPARRYLPFSHWAIVDLLEQPLHQKPESLGYFTATPMVLAKNNKSTSSSDMIGFAGKLVWNMTTDMQQQQQDHDRSASKINKWGEVVSVVTTTGIRNSPLIATVQGFYEAPIPPKTTMSSKPTSTSMPPSLQARKVILPKTKTIGFIVGPLSSKDMNMQKANQNNNQQQYLGCCKVLFPNGMASGPSSIQALKGSRAILYD